MNSIKFLTTIAFLFLISCQSKKASTETIKISEEKMITEGFKKAVVIYSAVPGDCEYTISVEGESTLFDPINLEASYKNSQTKIWVKYNPLRMPNRCEKANPVEITDISSRN